MTDRSHSAGGLGGVMGSKNLKAIGVIGTGVRQDRRRQKGLERAGRIPAHHARRQLGGGGAQHVPVLAARRVLRRHALDGGKGPVLGRRHAAGARRAIARPTT